MRGQVAPTAPQEIKPGSVMTEKKALGAQELRGLEIAIRSAKFRRQGFPIPCGLPEEIYPQLMEVIRAYAASLADPKEKGNMTRGYMGARSQFDMGDEDHYIRDGLTGWFVMLKNARGGPMPLVTEDDVVILFDSQKAASDAGKANPLGEAFGFELYEWGQKS
jgi:hypothetical protein